MVVTDHGWVREATASDAHRVFELASQLAMSFRPQRSAFDRSFAVLLADEGCLPLVAEADGELAGYLLGFTHPTFFANGPVGWVEELMVAPGARRRGVGRELMAAFEEWCAGRGCRLVAAATRRASGFYTGLGYEESATYLRKLFD